MTEIELHLIIGNRRIFGDSKRESGNHIQTRIVGKRKEIGFEVFREPVTIVEFNVSENNYNAIEQIDDSHYICYIT